MEPFQSIIVGVDLDATGQAVSLGSRAALEQARWLAGKGATEFRIVHSTSRDHFVEIADENVVVVREGLPPAGREALNEAVLELESAGARARLCLCDDKPWIALIQEAARARAQLTIVGRHDVRETGPRIGSVAAKLMRKSPAAVWVARPEHGPAPSRILAATDLGEVGALAIEAGAGVARMCSARLDVVHAYQIPMGAEWTRDPDELPDPRSLHGEAERKVHAQLRSHGGGLQGRVHVACTTPVRAILTAVDRCETDLLVMGTVSRGGIPGFLIGNTAETVLPRSTCSLLVVKPTDFVSPIHLEVPAEPTDERSIPGLGGASPAPA